MVIANGRAIRQPAAEALIPKWLKNELAPILETGSTRMPPGRLEKFMNAVNGFSLLGPLDITYHA